MSDRYYGFEDEVEIPENTFMEILFKKIELAKNTASNDEEYEYFHSMLETWDAARMTYEDMIIAAKMVGIEESLGDWYE